jgi:hypothetical protein
MMSTLLAHLNPAECLLHPTVHLSLRANKTAEVIFINTYIKDLRFEVVRAAKVSVLVLWAVALSSRLVGGHQRSVKFLSPQTALTS